MINMFGIERIVGLPNGDTIQQADTTLTASIDKLSGKLIIEFKNPIGTANKFIFPKHIEKQLFEFMQDKAER